MVGLENFELAGIKTYTRFWGLLMFGSYSVINVIVLLNLLIAMMSNSYAMIDEHSDVEWKFARTRLWMSYFEESATLPPPFNILPTPKLFLKMLGLRKKDKVKKIKSEEHKEKELDVRYTAVMRALVWRYVSAMHRKMDDEPVTEDDINELKGDVSALRYELLEVFERSGMDVSFTDRKEKMVLGKRMKMWERRLMKDFHVAPVALEEEKPADEDGLSRFRRIARMAIANTTNAKWDQTLARAGVSTQIGRCRSRESFKNQQNLQRAMDEARKLVLRSPLPEGSRVASPIEMPVTPGHTLLEIIKDISTEVAETMQTSPSPKPEGSLLAAAGVLSGSVSPSPSASTPVPTTAAVKTPSKAAPSAPTSRVASPLPTTVSPPPTATSPPPVVSKPAERPISPQLDPSLLKEKSVSAETTPSKVVKKKPPLPPSGPDEQAPEKPVESESKPTAVARPVAPEIKPSEGAIPPPPPAVKPKAPLAPTMEITPSTPPVHAPSAPEVKSPATPKVAPKPPPPRVASPTPATLTTATPSPSVPSSPSKCLQTTSSTEQLIPSPSPKTLRPAKKLDEISTIRRQPKTGWL